jgi:hypothetical protein
MTIENLIKNLANSKIKEKLPSPLKTTLCAVSFLAIYLIILLEFFGLRSDLFIELKNGKFILELALNILVIVLAIVAISHLRLPNINKNQKIIFALIAIFLTFSALICLNLYGNKSQEMCGGEGYQCLLGILLFSLLPMFFLAAILHRGVMTNYTASFIAIGISGGCFAYLVERLANPVEDGVHLIVWHFMPIFLVILLSSFLVKKLIKKL